MGNISEKGKINYREFAKQIARAAISFPGIVALK
jgi:hypothetical protein